MGTGMKVNLNFRWLMGVIILFGFTFNTYAMNALFVKSGGSVISLAAANSLLNNPSSGTAVVRQQYEHINLGDGDVSGQIGQDAIFPFDNHFAVRFSGTITITEEAIYTFALNADDGSQLIIDGETVIYDNSTHATHATYGSVELAVGEHNFEVNYFEAQGYANLELFAAQGQSDGIDNLEHFELLGQTISAKLPSQIANKPSYIAGQWSPVMPWPLIAVSAANFPDGRLLTWSSSSPADSNNTQFTNASIYNPATNEFSQKNLADHNMFCPGISLQEDGSVLVAGGHPHIKTVSRFSLDSEEWLREPDLTVSRWYPTNVQLPDNRTFSTFAKHAATTSEVFTPGGEWLNTTGASMTTLLSELQHANAHQSGNGSTDMQWYAFMHVAPNGKVFHSGPTKTMHWFDLNEPLGATTTLGQRLTEQGTPDQNRHFGSAVMYDIGKLLVTGGNDPTLAIPSSNGAFTVDLNGPTPLVQQTTAMAYKRTFSSSVVLPNGHVMMIGGTASAKLFNDEGSQFIPEIWDPTTELWTEQNPLEVPRNYHSVALLMKDGRVFTAGGGLCGNCAANHQDAQFFKPAYFFNVDGSEAQRPVINSTVTQTTAGASFTVDASNGVTQFNMIRLAGTTHSINSDQRFIPLTITSNENNLYEVKLTDNPNVVIPGYYWMFAMNANGVPSVGATVQVVRAQVEGGNKGALVKAVNAGGPAYHSSVGLTYELDDFSNGHNASYTASISNSSDDLLYQTERWVQGSLIYDIPVDNGDYIIDIELAELWPGAMGKGLRVFDIFLENELVADNLDIFSTAGGGNKALHLSFEVEVSDGTFSLALKNIIQNPKISAFAIYKVKAVDGDRDGDGVPDHDDVFPDDPNESKDSDHDGVGDNGDAFPTNAKETKDSDGDGVGDNGDAYPLDPALQVVAKRFASTSSTTVIIEPNVAGERIWNVNPDNNSVTVVNAANNQVVAKIDVGKNPWSLAKAPLRDEVYVSNKADATLTVIDTNTLQVIRTVMLQPGSQNHSVIFAANSNTYYVTLEALSMVEKRSALDDKKIAQYQGQGLTRHLALSEDGKLLYLSRYITPPLTGEATASVNVEVGGGQVWVVGTTTMSLIRTVTLGFDTASETESSGPGVPNYLNAPVLSTDGAFMYVPSKQDNVAAGELRASAGIGMDFEHTVRAATSVINLNTFSANPGARLDHDNSSLATGAAISGDNHYLFVALETSREVEVYNIKQGYTVGRLNVGRAPQGIAISNDGTILYVHNFMDRSLSVFSIVDILTNVSAEASLDATVALVENERLSAIHFKGKQLFYDAADERLATDKYMSCASCHNEGGHDGRVWDLTGMGEGLRNTISLLGKGGMAHGLLHWTGNFDEIQDFEGQIRSLASGTGLMSDSNFHSGTRSQPLGDKKSGFSSDLDALAAYVSSLNKLPAGFNTPESDLSVDAANGKMIFEQTNCQSCHAGANFTDSNSGIRHDIGTINFASGFRLAQSLQGIDTPTLLDLPATAPYLHNGSASTIKAAILAHDNVNIGETDVDAIVSYLKELTPGKPILVTAINAGGQTFTASNGVTYQNDQYFSNSRTYNVAHDISSTLDGYLYQSERWSPGQLIYNIPLENGSYLVELEMAEIYSGTMAANARVFDIFIEGKHVENNLDVFTKSGGGYTALTLTYTVEVNDGYLTIQLNGSIQNPKISAFAIYEISNSTP